MGKAEIIESHGEGRYTVRINYSRWEYDSQFSAIEERIVQLQAIIPTLEGKDKIVAGAGLKAAEYGKQRLELLMPEDTELIAWCADYSVVLSGEVGTAEPPGEFKRRGGDWGFLNILPGHEGGADYDKNRDGQLMPVFTVPDWSWLLNNCITPGWQKFKPLYRYGQITDIDRDNNNCGLNLYAAESYGDGLNINQTETLSGVPFEYMECNHLVFEVGDDVLIKFNGQNWAAPVVIGFKQEPRPCDLKFYLRPTIDGNILRRGGWGFYFRFVDKSGAWQTTRTIYVYVNSVGSVGDGWSGCGGIFDLTEWDTTIPLELHVRAQRNPEAMAVGPTFPKSWEEGNFLSRGFSYYKIYEPEDDTRWDVVPEKFRFGMVQRHIDMLLPPQFKTYWHTSGMGGGVYSGFYYVKGGLVDGEEHPPYITEYISDPPKPNEFDPPAEWQNFPYSLRSNIDTVGELDPNLKLYGDEVHQFTPGPLLDRVDLSPHPVTITTESGAEKEVLVGGSSDNAYPYEGGRVRIESVRVGLFNVNDFDGGDYELERSTSSRQPDNWWGYYPPYDFSNGCFDECITETNMGSTKYTRVETICKTLTIDDITNGLTTGTVFDRDYNTTKRDVRILDYDFDFGMTALEMKYPAKKYRDEVGVWKDVGIAYSAKGIGTNEVLGFPEKQDDFHQSDQLMDLKIMNALTTGRTLNTDAERIHCLLPYKEHQLMYSGQYYPFHHFTPPPDRFETTQLFWQVTNDNEENLLENMMDCYYSKRRNWHYPLFPPYEPGWNRCADFHETKMVVMGIETINDLELTRYSDLLTDDLKNNYMHIMPALDPSEGPTPAGRSDIRIDRTYLAHHERNFYRPTEYDTVGKGKGELVRSDNPRPTQNNGGDFFVEKILMPAGWF